MSSSQLAALTSPDIDRQRGRLLLIPLGSCEQHGPHLPLDTDARVATALAARVGAERPDLFIAPTLQFGASGEHCGFPGTVSIGTEALSLLLVELARSLGDEFSGLVYMSWHGGNADGLGRAVTQLRAEGHHVMGLIPTVAHGDAHAGRTETSIMLAIAPESVRMELAAAGDNRPLREIMPLLREGGLKAVAASGVLGDPAGASAEEGERLLAELIRAALDAIEQWGGLL